jgi:spore coat polysaccharide biosynthesis predicted glycosyltransferase SpsG
MSLRAVFRCDGDATIGAGHVGRCVQLARPLAGIGGEVVFVGRFGGTAAALLERAGMQTATPEEAASQPPPDVVVADGYELRDADLAPLRRGAPVLVVSADEPLPPPYWRSTTTSGAASRAAGSALRRRWPGRRTRRLRPSTPPRGGPAAPIAGWCPSAAARPARA